MAATLTRTTLRNNSVDLTAVGMNINQQDRGDWLQNFYLQNGSLIVREGFGQVARFSTGLTANSNVLTNTTDNESGFRQVLGTQYINTDFGHEQILTVIRTKGWSADRTSVTLASTKSLYSVVIYDITTRQKKELVLYEHNSQVQSEQVPIFRQQGHYETNSSRDHQEWTEGSDNTVFFTEYQDRVFFGGPKMGVWFYTPCIFTDEKNVPPTVTRTWNENEHETTYRSEDHIIVPVAFTENKQFTGDEVNEDGSLSKVYTYFTPSQVTEVVDATPFQGRMVYAGGRSVLFSDIGKPNSVAAANFISVDSEEEITAIQGLRDSLLIFTANETFLYLPNNDPFIITAGRIYELSKNVGCINAQAKTRMGDGCVWVDANGFWLNTGNTTINKLSEPIDPFFNTFVSRPLTNWYKNDGGNGGTDGQKLNIDTSGQNIHVVYEPEEQRLFFVFPDENFAWVRDTGGFKLWTWKTIANNGDEEDITETENIVLPRLTVDGKGGIFLIGGIEEEVIVSDDGRGGLNFNNFGTFYILEWKRGGGLDRTSVPQEDNVDFRGEYEFQRIALTTDDARFVIDKPVKVPEGTPLYSFNDPGGTVHNARSNTFLLPIRLLGSSNFNLVQSFDVQFTYDNVNYSFVTDPTAPGTPNVLAVVPTERIGSAPGYTLGASTFLPPFAYVATFFGGAPVVGGDTIRVRWNGQNGFGVNPWSFPDGVGGGYMNISNNTVQTLLFLVMEKTGTALDPNFTLVNTSDITSDTAGPFNIGATIWRAGGYSDQIMTTDEKAQPVEYVYKTKQVGDGMTNIKARGLSMNTVSTGKATTSIFPNWVYGLYNTLLGSDQKEWATQVVDLVDPNGQQDKNLQNIKRIVNKDTTIPRLRSATQQPTVPNTYGNAAATWASLGDGTDGTVLSANNAENVITQSDSVRGGRFSYTMFGFIQNKAEKLKFNAVKAAMRVVGALRRR